MQMVRSRGFLNFTQWPIDGKASDVFNVGSGLETDSLGVLAIVRVVRTKRSGHFLVSAFWYAVKALFLLLIIKVREGRVRIRQLFGW